MVDGPVRWVCPECQRTFGRKGQGHHCEPGMTLDAYFATAHERERPIFDVVAVHLESLGPVVIEPVSIGIMFKNGPRFAELRTMKKWVALTFMYPIRLDSDRISRKPIQPPSPNAKWYHVINITDPDQIDEEILDWLTASYFACEE